MNNRNTLHKPLRALRASRLLLLLTLAPAATTGLKAQSYYDEATQLYMDSLDSKKYYADITFDIESDGVEEG